MDDKNQLPEIKTPPKGLAILLLVGPSVVWASEYIGSGEVIIATRTGAILGNSVIWAIIIGVALKFWIGMSGARYTVCTGEGMMDMFDRMPGPKHWAVWIVLVAQFVAGTISIGSVATAGGVFISSLIPVSPAIGGWIVTLTAFFIAWKGEFQWLKVTMSILILMVILGVFYVCAFVLPSFPEFIHGMIPHKPILAPWVIDNGITDNPWKEILPLLGWSAGGFASQVWYSYWVMGAGYGATRKNLFGVPADMDRLRNLNITDAKHLKGWCKMVYTDSFLAMVIGILVTAGFLVAGAGILAPREIAPEGNQVALQLSTIFSSQWGKLGGILFMIGGTAALISTNIGQMAGWPRLLADSFRICIPAYNRTFKWKIQYRMFLVFFFITNMTIVYSLGYQPVVLVKFSAILEGLLLTPLQALVILVALYFIMPKFYKPDVSRILHPHWIFAAGLIIAFLFFGYFCIYQLPRLL